MTFKITPNKEKAIFLAKRQLPEFVYDAVNLEGIHYTLPEVQTLLDGVTIGGHRMSDQKITLNQANAWKHLFSMLEENTFSLTKEIACRLHSIAAKEESLKWGCFREGGVTIAGTDYIPPSADKLDALWEAMVTESKKNSDIYDRAIFIFLQMSRYQFFYDVNKRMGRFLMNGLLLDSGYPAINLPAKKQVEFNKLMLKFYISGNTSPMTEFMKTCLDQKVIDVMNEKAS